MSAPYIWTCLASMFWNFCSGSQLCQISRKGSLSSVMRSCLNTLPAGEGAVLETTEKPQRLAAALDISIAVARILEFPGITMFLGLSWMISLKRFVRLSCSVYNELLQGQMRPPGLLYK